MNPSRLIFSRYSFSAVFAACAIMLIAAPALPGEYSALKGVKGIKTVFDMSQGSPGKANSVFWAVKNLYEDESVRSLPEPPQVTIVFRGPAVKLISTSHAGFKGPDIEALEQFADKIRQMKKDGVKMEVCLFAVKVQGINPATILPEVDQVGNGFISIAGYQAQGYSVVTLN